MTLAADRPVVPVGDRTMVPVDVIRVALSRTPGSRDLELLTEAERARAARFRFARDSGRYISGRAALRRVLGERLGTAPGAVEISYGEYGKPYVPGVSTQFNVSHSDDVALIAVADGVAA
ncbi:MAG: 4-phosphopantetheinyl transferase, partial [Frankiaceae bacterium]|nr:4-phosphopantetheinyl transferase [Frankiaceae bacterium]